VRVGTAVRSSDGGFVLRLSELRIGAAPAQASAGQSWGGGERRGGYSAPPAAPSYDSGGGGGGGAPGGMVFPPYGRSKGQPIAGSSMGDLEFYRNGCLRTLGDPAKSRWHDKERTLLAAIEAEIIRQKGMPAMDSPSSDRGGYGGPPPGFDERPPPDDDVPF
jgi:hypothetical protein